MPAKAHRLLVLTLLLLSGAPPRSMAEESPVWSLDGTYRLRYESLDQPFRANASGSDQILVSRLLLSLKGRGEHGFSELELQDSRAWLDDSDTPLGTDDVNAFEPLQAYLGWQGTTNSGDAFAVKAGRFTMDIGSRRFVARNRFRNTINAFTGVHVDWKTSWHWQAYYTLPVQRQPNARNELDANEIEFDEEFRNVRFWGLDGAGKVGVANLELFWFALQERDGGGLATDNQDFYTLGARWWRAPSARHWDYEVEAAYQFGESRNSAAPTDTNNLDHRASFLHSHLGYQFDDTWQSRLTVEFDYASGDKNPTDNESNRFVTLFGARRFDFGPTGIYGPIIRGNIITPGLQWEFAPTDIVRAFVGYRAFWLAEKRDGLTAAGLRDISGNSGRFVGQQLEARWQLNVAAQWQVELGGAYLMKGEFLKDAPNAPDTGDTIYVYSQIVYRFE